MASLIAKKKGNQLYYYVVESARVDGQPRIIHQSYLGSAEKVAALVRDRTAPLPLSATLRDFGLPGALWVAAQQTGVFELLQQLWPPPRTGPSPAHYLLLAAIHRICQPGPKTEVSDWYDRTVLQPLWGFAAERFTASLLGLLRDPGPGAAGCRSQRRTRPGTTAPGRFVEAEAVGQPPLARVRHHQLLHLHRQHQHPEPPGTTRPQ